jgi:transposase-like protein
MSCTHLRLWALLYTKYPCCGGRSRFRAIKSVPRETYERRCPRCGRRWNVERRTSVEEQDKRIDILEWEAVK